jgi:hypothetical protein
MEAADRTRREKPGMTERKSAEEIAEEIVEVCDAGGLRLDNGEACSCMGEIVAAIREAEERGRREEREACVSAAFDNPEIHVGCARALAAAIRARSEER